MGRRPEQPEPPQWRKRHQHEDRVVNDNTREILAELKRSIEAHQLRVVDNGPHLHHTEWVGIRGAPAWWTVYGSVAVRDDGEMLVWEGTHWAEKRIPISRAAAKTANFGLLYGGRMRGATQIVAMLDDYVDRNGNQYTREALEDMHRQMQETLDTMQENGVSVGRVSMRQLMARTRNPCGEISMGVDWGRCAIGSWMIEPPPPKPKPDLGELGAAMALVDMHRPEGAWKVPHNWKLKRDPVHGNRFYHRDDGVYIIELYRDLWGIVMPHNKGYHYRPQSWIGNSMSPKKCITWVTEHLEYPWVPVTRMELLFNAASIA